MDKPKFTINLSKTLLFITSIFFATSLVPALSVSASGTSTPIYTDSLAPAWQDWSWNAKRNLANTFPVQSGSHSIAVTITSAWGALYLHDNTPLSTGGYTALEFYINGGASGRQRLNLIANGNTSHSVLVTPAANTWTKISIPLTSLGSPASLVDLYWQDAAGTSQPKFYLDAIFLVGSSSPTATPVGPIPPTRTGTSAPLFTATPAPLPSPTATPGSGGHFTTLPPGSALPSDAACAAAVQYRPENKGMNKAANATPGSQKLASDFFGTADDPRANSVIAPRVTGNYTGTTDQILQWAACKWGIDEDIVRAQAAQESWWHQTAMGDWTTDATRCSPGHGLGVDGVAGQCPESWGILQNRYPYEQSSWPGIYTSTAFNADTAYGIWRACYEGYEWWLNSVDRGSQYAAGDAWGCVGRWYAGRWHTTAADGYIAKVQNYLNIRVWESASFQEP